MQSCRAISLNAVHPAVSISSKRLTGTVSPFLIKRQNRINVAAPIKAAAEPPPPMPTWEPTGVPLVDDLAAFKTLQDSGIHAAKLIAIAFVGVYLGSLIMNFIAEKLGGVGPITEGFHPVRALTAAVAVPVARLLPLYGWIYSATVVSSLIQVAAGKAKAQFNQICFGNGPQVLNVIKYLTQIVQDASEIVVIAGAAWAVINLKDRFFDLLNRSAFKDKEALARLMGTFSSLLNYAIYAGGIFASLATCGVDITPLLASLGASSIVLGIAAQSVLQNVASSLTLFTAPPFAAGDTVQFMAGGAPVMAGTVVAIEPMRTVLRSAEGSTIYVANSKVVEWEVQNDSRKI